MSLPVIDMSALFGTDVADRREVAAQIAAACEDVGFFYAIGHGVAPATLQHLEAAAQTFFDLPLARKQAIAMEHGGRAWRGWFPLRGELTSGQPDNKEGLYLGEELPPEDPRVAAGWPLHGANLWPAGAPALQPAVEAFFAQADAAAGALMQGVSLALGLDDHYFARHYLQRPTRLFRIFRYPPTPAPDESGEAWGVGEHTDYGLLTLLAQDDAGGLEVRGPAGWRPAPPIPGALVCNIGDMLERLTGGRFVSTPHRVVNRSDRPRLSFPFFYDPDFTALMVPVPGAAGPASSAPRTASERWDGADVHAVSGAYGEYLMAKVARVFPGLGSAVLPA